MLDSLYLRLADLSPAALIIIPLAIMFFCAFGMTRITKRLRLPSVTAYLTAGILIGPCCLNLIPQPMIEKTDFLADLASNSKPCAKTAGRWSGSPSPKPVPLRWWYSGSPGSCWG